MPEPLDRITKEIMDVGPRMLNQIGKQLENLQDAISLNPTDDEVTAALGKEAALVEREAYRRGHQSGWYKGALMFGFAVLAGLAVVSLSISGESKKNAF
ncbi:MAG: hypothetical protein DMG06_27450 [Acidobacteria bacterium]|nr:MAG: hypothetical protein DMG06_27450 [Acidobacteriota bacterium]